MTVRDLLAAVRAAQGIPSNYRLARVLGVTETTVQRWNTGANLPDDAMSARLAEMAGFDPDMVVASMHAERAHEPGERARWTRIAERLGTAAMLAVCAMVALWTTGTPDGGAYLSAAMLPALVDSSFVGLYIVACCVAALAAGAGLRHWPARMAPRSQGFGLVPA